MTACKPGWCIHTTTDATLRGARFVALFASQSILLCLHVRQKWSSSKHTWLHMLRWFLHAYMTISTQRINYALDNKSICRTIEVHVQLVFLSFVRGHWSTVHSTLNFKFPIGLFSSFVLGRGHDHICIFNLTFCKISTLLNVKCRSNENTYRVWFHQYISSICVLFGSHFIWHACEIDVFICVCEWVSVYVYVCNQRLANDLILLLIDSSTAKCVKLPVNTIRRTHTHTYILSPSVISVSFSIYWFLYSLVFPIGVTPYRQYHTRRSSYSPENFSHKIFWKRHWFNQNVWWPKFITIRRIFEPLTFYDLIVTLTFQR